MVKILISFTVGFVFYPFLEILWRGYTHPTMCFAGGMSLCMIYITAKYFKGNIFLKSILCSVFITFIELIFGIVFNIIFKMNVWDYSELPYNFMGQICLGYFLLWFAISIVLICFYYAFKYISGILY